MQLNYSEIAFDKDGIPETPELVLKTLAGDTIGVIPGAFNIEFDINYAETSELEFDVAAKIDGQDNWIYDRITGHMIIYTKTFGVYVTMNPTINSDGIEDIIHVTAYSLEKVLESKIFYMEEGTFKFCNTLDPTDTNTLMGRILEIAVGWSAGYISPTVAQKYRTFDEYDDYLLSFIYDEAPEKYRCVFVFDTYNKTINVYDADEELEHIPIYLDFENLLEEVEVEELSDELVTAICPYGADDVNIRTVNPIGTNWIYDLSYFISKGDISGDLATKWEEWERSILSNRSLYEGLSALRASATARLLAAQAALTDLEGELDTLLGKQSITIQALALETTDKGIEHQQSLLDEINASIAAKNEEIAAQEAVIAEIEAELDENNEESYPAQIAAIVNELKITNYFTEDEYQVLSNYIIEQVYTDETFVATDVDTSVSGTSYTLDDETLSISDCAIVKVPMSSSYQRDMYTFTGGTFTLGGDYDITADIIRGTMEAKSDGTCVISFYAGTITVGESTLSSGLITISASYSNLTSDVAEVTEDEITTYEGTSLNCTMSDGAMYLTVNVSDYQVYSVSLELYDYTAEVLADVCTPTYEFSVDSGNFLFEKNFAPFRNSLELGKGIYLNLGHGEVINPYIIEVKFEFEDRSKFELTFSNRFKRHDSVNTLADMIEQSYSSSRSFDSSKYTYNQAASQASTVSEFMNSSINAAVNKILGATDQSVVISGAGINIGGDSNYQIRIVDSMIAMTDDNWSTAKVAIGLFATEELGEYWGVNADVIAGKLLVGSSLVIECENDDGVLQFMVDASGAWLNNATFILQKDGGGQIIIDPNYGIAAGPSGLFTTSGTTVTPSFIDEKGNLVKDDDGFPEGTNFYLDIDTGNAYFRGNYVATSGSVGGWTIADGFLYGGSDSTYVCLNVSGTDYASYAIWAGNDTPSSAPFYVMKDGTVKMTNAVISGDSTFSGGGTFTGTLNGADGSFSGTVTATSGTIGGWTIGTTSIYNQKPTYSSATSGAYIGTDGINIGGSATYFKVSSAGKLTCVGADIEGTITAEDGEIGGFTITSTAIYNGTRSLSSAISGVYLGTDGIRLYNDSSAYVTISEGTLTCVGATINGAITATEMVATNVRINGKMSTYASTGSTAASGYIGYLTGSTDISTSTSGIGLVNASYTSCHIIATDAGVRMNAGSYSFYVQRTAGSAAANVSSFYLYGTDHSANLFIGNAKQIYFNNSGGTAVSLVGMDSSNQFFAGSASYATYVRGSNIYINGTNIYMNGTAYSSSDRRIKNSIEVLPNKYDSILDHIEPVRFRYNNDQSGKYRLGYIAQDIDSALCNAGVDDAENGIVLADADGILHIDYSQLIPLLHQRIRHLEERIATLEQELMPCV